VGDRDRFGRKSACLIVLEADGHGRAGNIDIEQPVLATPELVAAHHLEPFVEEVALQPDEPVVSGG
jgi:hypothetical protein